MAKTSAPSYQMYPDSFDQGTDDMTLSEVGGYIRLLNSQWAKGFVPGDRIEKLAKIMRCTPATAKSVWAEIQIKFQRDEDGRWRNVRLEEERAKQQRRRDALAKNGALGGRPVNQNETYRFPNGKPNGNQKKSLPSPSPKEQQQHAGARGYDRQHAKHLFGFCDWVCLPEFLFNEFVPKARGGAEAVLTWARSVRAEWEGRDIPQDSLVFWRARWAERTPATDAEAAALQRRGDAHLAKVAAMTGPKS